MNIIGNRVTAGVAAVVITFAAPMVAYFEGYVPHTYKDAVQIPTICYGHTGADVTPGRKASRDECLSLLKADLIEAYDDVESCVFAPITIGQNAALVSFAYNTGRTTLCSSTMVRMINAGAPAEEWCPQLDRFVYARGIKLPGLVVRRKKERELCEFGPWIDVIAGSRSTAPIQ